MNSSISLNLSAASCLLVVTLILAGCQDSKLGSVTGVVSINGKPIEMASISFIPDFGRASVGSTNDKGEYMLNYTNAKKGALIGKHKVTISTKYRAETNYSRKTYNEEGLIKPTRSELVKSKGRKETVPKKFRDPRATELTAIVEPGSNEINFNLEL